MRPIIVFTLAAIAACSESPSCHSTLQAEAYSTALRLCREAYQRAPTAAALSGWVRAAGENDALDQVIAAVQAAAQTPGQAEAMMLAATYAVRAGDTALAQRFYQQSAHHFQQTGLEVELSQALHGLYRVAWERSDHREALNFATDSLDAARRAGDERRELAALNALFTVFEDVGSLGPAQHTLDLINEKLGEQVTPARINAYISQGLLHMSQQHYGLAAHEFDLALAAASGSKNHSALRGLHLNIVHANLEIDRLQKAEAHMQTAWGYANPNGTVRFALNYYQAKLYLKQNQYAQAREHLLLALDDPAVPDIWIWELHYWAGQAAAAMGERAWAVASYRQSVAALEVLRSELALAELKSHLLIRKRKAYEALFANLIASGETLEAFALSEQAKSRSFIDAFIASGSTAMRSDGQARPGQQTADRIDSVRAYVDRLRISPVAEVRATADILAQVGERVLLSYFSADGQLYVLAVTSGHVSAQLLSAEPTRLRALIDTYKQNPDSTEVLEELGAQLLPPTMLPAPGQTLYIAPDALVSELAFAGLRVDGQFLVQRHDIALVPSASAMLALATQRTTAVAPAATATIDPKDYLIVGDPTGDLPAAREEALEVAAYLGTPAVIGTQASAEQVMQSAHLRVLHLAMHSGIGPLGPWLRFANGEMAGAKLLSKNLAPELAVLASCASGAGQGADFWGSLGGLFLSAGTPSVVVSIGAAEDTTTRLLVNDFYREYLTTNRPSAALADAQKRAIASGLAPRAWAPFAVMGDVLAIRGTR